MDVFPSEVYPSIDAIDHSPDGKLAIGSSKLTGRYWNGSLWLFKTPDQAPDSIYAPDNKHCSCCASTNAGCTDLTWLDEKRLAFASDNGVIELWCVGESFNEVEILANLTGHDDIVQSISVNCGRVKIVSASLDMSIRVWDLEREACTDTFQGHSDAVYGVCFRQEEQEIFASASEDGSIVLWDLRNDKPARRLLNSSHHLAAPLCLTWDQTGNYLAIGYKDGSVSCYDVRNVGQPQVKRKPHCRDVNAVAFCPKRPSWLASVSNDCVVNILDLDASQSCYQNNDHKDFVRDLSWSPVDGCLRTCGWDTQIIRHTPTMIEEGMDTKVNKTVALETSVIARVGCNGIISTVNKSNLIE